MNSITPVTRRKLATFAAVAIAVWPATVVTLHIVQRGSYDPATQAVSELALGPYGMVLNVAFVVFGLGLLALAIGLRRDIARSRPGAALLAVVGLLVVLSGVFPTTDPSDTIIATIHMTVGIAAFLTVMVAIFSWAWLFRRDPRWRAFSKPTTVWGAATVTTFLLFPLLENTAFGIAQRIFIAVWLSWTLVTAIRLRRTAPDKLPAHQDPQPSDRTARPFKNRG